MLTKIPDSASECLQKSVWHNGICFFCESFDGDILYVLNNGTKYLVHYRLVRIAKPASKREILKLVDRAEAVKFAIKDGNHVSIELKMPKEIMDIIKNVNNNNNTNS